MSEINIDSYIASLYLDEDLRPSVKRQTTDALYAYHIYKVGAFCRKTKSELEAIDGIDVEILSIIETKLHEAGFTLGMSEDELEEIEDAEYFSRHPESKKTIAPAVTKEKNERDLIIQPDKPFDAFTLSQILRGHRVNYNSGVGEDTPQKKVPLTSSLRMRLLNKREESSRDMINRMIAERGLMRMRPEDFDCIRFALFRMYFFHQPWIVRLLYSTRERMLRAKWQSEKLFDAYMEVFVDEIVEAYIKTYDKELETNWETNWERYLTDLED